MLHAKYESSSPYGLSQVDFERFPSLFLCKIGCAQAVPKCDHRRIILIILEEDHQIMLRTEYKCSSQYGLSEVNSFKDFLPCFYVK